MSPIYIYKGKNGKTFELFQRMSDEPLREHPSTGETIQRVYTAPAIKFKGAGFYTTDYKISGEEN